jgi:hypothetical protein
MHIGMNELLIREENREANVNLRTDVSYVLIPHENFPGLIRRTTLTNLGTSSVTLSVLDGLTKIEPYGINEWFLKSMGRTVQAWYNVYNLDHDPSVPFFRVSSTVADSEVVFPVNQGNWATAFVEGADGQVGEKLPFVVDPGLSLYHLLSLCLPRVMFCSLLITFSLLFFVVFQNASLAPTLPILLLLLFPRPPRSLLS